MPHTTQTSCSRAREIRFSVGPDAASIEIADESWSKIVTVCEVSRHGLGFTGCLPLPVGERVHITGLRALDGARAMATLMWCEGGRGGLRIERFTDKASEILWLDFLEALHSGRLRDVVLAMGKSPEEPTKLLAWLAEGERLREERRMREFARSMSLAVHDLANPIAAAYSTVQILTSGLMDAAQFTESGLARIIERNCERALVEIEEILKASWLTEPKAQLALADVDVAALVTEVGESHLARAQAKGIELTWNVTPGLSMRADRGKMLRVLGNLVSNAVKYSRAGDAVVMAVFTTATDIVLQVRDTGVGMSREEVRRIFEPFREGGPRPTDGEPSHGIGLTACRAIVLAHAGSLDVTSQPGQGSVFTVRFPVRH